MNIFGAKGQISNIDDALPIISKLEKDHNSTIQLFRADRIFGTEHLQTATELATRSWDRKTAKANTLGMEILLYAAAERQISVAIDKLGIVSGATEFAIVTVGQINPEEVLTALNLQSADVLGAEGKDYSIFDISQEEIAALSKAQMASISDLVLERMALSELNR